MLVNRKATYIALTLFLSIVQAVYGQHIRCGVHRHYHWHHEISYAHTREALVIPVVFHIVYNDDDQNISRKRILEQVDQLNADFNRDNLDLVKVEKRWERRIGNANIRFCLADIDPDGEPTTGIIRTKTTIDSIGGRYNPEGINKLLKHAELGGSSSWDTEKYLNVWVSDRGDGVLGIATFPADERVPKNEQGVEIYYQAISGNPDESYPYGLGRTLTHEIGHFLGLQHLWGSELSCFSEGDDISDTPKQGKAYFGCPSPPQSSCGSTDMISNFMDFSYDACLNFFTEGQVERMRAVLLSTRFELVSSGLCDADTPIPPDPLALSEISYTDFGIVVKLDRLPEIDYTLKLYDITGQLYWQEKKNFLSIHLINTNRLPTGVYLLQLTANKTRVVRKLPVIR